MCNYTYENGSNCTQGNYNNSRYCILHGDDFGSVKKNNFQHFHVNDFNTVISRQAGNLERVIFPNGSVVSSNGNSLNFKDCFFYGTTTINHGINSKHTNIIFENCEGKAENPAYLKIDSSSIDLKFQNSKFFQSIQFAPMQHQSVQFENCTNITVINFSNTVGASSIICKNSILGALNVQKNGDGIIALSDCTFDKINLKATGSYPITIDTCVIEASSDISGRFENSEINFFGVECKKSLSVEIQEHIQALRFMPNGRRKKTRFKVLSVLGTRPIADIFLDQVKADFVSFGFSALRGKLQINNLNANRLKIAPSNPSNDTDIYEQVSIKEIEIKDELQVSDIMVQTLSFRNNEIEGKTYFKNCHFLGDADFQGTTFKDDAVFKCSSKSREASADTVHGLVSFAGTVFLKDVDFSNRKFDGSLSFDKTHFHEAPNFSGASLSQHTTMETAYFHDVENSRVKQYAPERYRTLKHKMEELRDRRSQGKFFRCEQIAYRILKRKSWFERLLSLSYEKVSNYGTSIGKPLAWICACILFFGLIFLLPSVWNGCGDTPYEKCFGSPINESFKNVFKPFESFRSDHKTNWRSYVGALESLMIYSLFAVFLISVRWRFKKD